MPSASKLVLLAFWSLVLALIIGDAARAQEEEIDVSRLSSPSLVVAGNKVTLTPPGVRIRDRTLVIPIRPVAQALIADLTVDMANQVIRVVRADNRAEITYDGKTGLLSNAVGRQKDADLVDWTPGNEALPLSILEQMFGIYPIVHAEQNEVELVPLSATFAGALESYKKELATTPRRLFTLPPVRLNAFQYDSLINSNTLTQTGEITTPRLSMQIGRTVVNSYATYVGSREGPAFRYSMGGINFIRPRLFNIRMGDYIVRSEPIFVSGLNRGIIAEKPFGNRTRVGFAVGRLQTEGRRVGVQTQRPIFKRDSGLLYAVFDSSDFKLRSPFWFEHRFQTGTGGGFFKDRNNNPIQHARGGLWYFFAKDDFTRFNGRLKSNTELEVGLSSANNNRNQPGSHFQDGSLIIFRQNTRLFKKLTITTLLQRGSPTWTTLDISNVFRNSFLYTQGFNLDIVRGINAFFVQSRSHPTARDQRSNVTTVYTAGGSFARFQKFLPTVSFTTNIQKSTTQGRAQYLNNLIFSKESKLLRTRLQGFWLSSNTGPQGAFNSVFQLSTQTTFWRNFQATFFRQWSTPETTQTVAGLNTGNLFGSYLSGSFSIGNINSQGSITRLLNAGMNVLIPYVNQRANVSFSKAGKQVQVLVNLSAFVGRREALLSAAAAPAAALPVTGTITGRFYLDNDLSGTFDPRVDTPLAGKRVIISGGVAGQTDGEGKYTARNVPKGFATVTTDLNAIPANLAFLNPSTQETFIFPGKTKVIDFRFARFARVSGKVVGTGAIPPAGLKDIRLYLVGTDKDTLTEEDGTFVLPDVAPGKYILKIDPEYVIPELEIVTGEVPVQLMPAEKLTGVKLEVRLREKKIEERVF